VDFGQNVAARYGRLIEHAVLLGCALYPARADGEGLVVEPAGLRLAEG
jgi:hypothetical protein